MLGTFVPTRHLDSIKLYQSFTKAFGGRKFSTIDSDANDLVSISELNVYAGSPVAGSNDPVMGKFNLIPDFFSNCIIQIVVDENCVNCVPDESLPGCPPERSFVVDDVIPSSTLWASTWGPDYESEQKLSFQLNIIHGLGTMFDQQPDLNAETGRFTFCLAESRNGSALYRVSLHDNGGRERGGINAFGTVDLAIRVYSVNQQPSFSFCSGMSCSLNLYKVPPGIVTCSGGCECNPSSVTASGTISDGPADYIDNMNCTWLIAAESQISLFFTFFATEEDVDFVTINRCSTSSCRSESIEEVARLSGSHVPSTTYTSSTGYLQLVFTSDYRHHYPGFIAHWNVSKLYEGACCSKNSPAWSSSQPL